MLAGEMGGDMEAEDFEEEAPCMEEAPVMQPLRESPVVPALFSKADGPSGLVDSMHSMSMTAVSKEEVCAVCCRSKSSELIAVVLRTCCWTDKELRP
jgi:hypothetical protein